MQEAVAEMKQALADAGACAIGFAEADEVSARAAAQFHWWLEAGNAAGLEYMQRNLELRFDPRGLLEGCRTVISTAWLYNPPRLRDSSLPYIARYAYSRDYHKALRSILKPCLRRLAAKYNFNWRICVDSAPVMERYWAVRSGVGFCGRNGLLIVPGVGSRVFLAEILLDLSLPADPPCTLSCKGCEACVRSCPAQALTHGSSPDCRRCISALTIEAPGSAGVLHRPTLAGCDVCQDVCPHNAGGAVTQIPELATLPRILTLDAEELLSMTDEQFSESYAGSALMRTGRQGLLKNLSIS